MSNILLQAIRVAKTITILDSKRNLYKIIFTDNTMNSFTHIISSFFPDVDIFKTAFDFPADRNSVINKDFVTYGFLNALHFGYIKYKEHNKYSVLRDSIITNDFISQEKREEMVDIFSKSQKAYFGFCRLARHFKRSRSRLYDADTDLYMNPLDNLKNHLVVELYDDSTRTRYRFRLSDLMTIAHNALSHSPDFFAEPQTIKNPYTNMPFSKAQLYSIYFRIRESTFQMPILFQQFFAHGMNLYEFCKYNECFIREEAIKTFVRSAPDTQKHYYVLKMLREHRRELRGIAIHPGFPQEKLMQAFSCYLHEYLLGSFSLNPALRHHSSKKLKEKLKRFQKLNPTYGRKIFTSRPPPPPPMPSLPSDGIFVFGSTSGRTDSPAEPSSPATLRGSYRFIDNVVLESPRLTPRTRAAMARMRRARRRRGSQGRMVDRGDQSYLISNYVVDEGMDVDDDESEVTSESAEDVTRHTIVEEDREDSDDDTDGTNDASHAQDGEVEDDDDDDDSDAQDIASMPEGFTASLDDVLAEILAESVMDTIHQRLVEGRIPMPPTPPSFPGAVPEVETDEDD